MSSLTTVSISGKPSPVWGDNSPKLWSLLQTTPLKNASSPQQRFTVPIILRWAPENPKISLAFPNLRGEQVVGMRWMHICMYVGVCT